MALIERPECGRDVSSKAEACPDCAFPVASGSTTAPVRAQARAASSSPLEVTKQIVGRLLFGGVLMASGAVWEAPPVVLSALFVWVTALPIWVKAKRAERLGAGPSHKGMSDQVESRLMDLEDRYRQHMSAIEESHSQQIADLDERLDFTERLLTKPREQLGP